MQLDDVERVRGARSVRRDGERDADDLARGIDERGARVAGREVAGEDEHLPARLVTVVEIATERFHAGYDLAEIQTAFNALEEATWMRVLQRLDASELAEALGLISTVLGAGKDALARAYVSLAADTNVESLDLRALFAGTS